MSILELNSFASQALTTCVSNPSARKTISLYAVSYGCLKQEQQPDVRKTALKILEDQWSPQLNIDHVYADLRKEIKDIRSYARERARQVFNRILLQIDVKAEQLVLEKEVLRHSTIALRFFEALCKTQSENQETIELKGIIEHYFSKVEDGYESGESEESEESEGSILDLIEEYKNESFDRACQTDQEAGRTPLDFYLREQVGFTSIFRSMNQSALEECCKDNEAIKKAQEAVDQIFGELRTFISTTPNAAIGAYQLTAIKGKVEKILKNLEIKQDKKKERFELKINRELRDFTNEMSRFVVIF